MLYGKDKISIKRVVRMGATNAGRRKRFGKGGEGWVVKKRR
jgi:hypothetical protein